MAEEHRVKTLVRTQGCKIDQCSCGAVHVSVGGTTMRISEGAARELRDSLVRALAAMDQAAVQAPAPSVRMLHAVDDEDEGGPNIH